MSADVEDIILEPCKVCSRTFRRESLAKHVKICEKNAHKHRKVFNSLQQRVSGTDFAPFHLPSYRKSATAQKVPASADKPQAFTEAHTQRDSDAATSAAASRLPLHTSRRMSMPATAIEQCAYCERKFGFRAYDRHVLWCGKKHACTTEVKEVNKAAKDRLAARLQYCVPLVNRPTVKEKYQAPAGAKEEAVKSGVPAQNVRRKNIGAPAKVIPRVNVANPSKLEGKLKSSRPTIPAARSENDKKMRDTSPDVYSPLLAAERQLRELLEYNDFTPYKSYTKISTSNNNNNEKPRAQSTHFGKPSLPHSSRLAASNPKPNIHRLTDVNTALEEDIEFEILENFVNQNFGNDDFIHNLDTIPLDSGSIGAENTVSCFDYVPIDPRLINEFDNLSIPDHLDTHINTTPGSFQPYGEVSRKRSYSMTDIIEEIEDLKVGNRRQPGKLVKGGTQIQMYSKKDKAQAPLGKANDPNAFTNDLSNLSGPDYEIYEEYKRIEQVYQEKKSRNRELHTDVAAVYADSAYGSLNRAPKTKIRSKAMQLAPLDQVYIAREEKECDAFSAERGGGEGESSFTYADIKAARFCHACGKKYPVESARFCIYCGSKRIQL